MATVAVPELPADCDLVVRPSAVSAALSPPPPTPPPARLAACDGLWDSHAAGPPPRLSGAGRRLT